jgi:drug/metabolite transporter (DMT)-like permease
MNSGALVFLVAFLFVITARQLAFKASSLAGGRGHSTALARPLFWAAIGSAPVEALLWLGFLSLVPLGQGVMAGSLGIVTVLLGGQIFFGEKLTRARVIAALIIVAGVTLVAVR